MAKLTIDIEKGKPRPEAERRFRQPPYAYTAACPDPVATEKEGGDNLDKGVEDIKKENERKKKYLRGYRRHGSKIKRIEAELDEIRSMKTSVSVNNDGMPHGSGQSDLSGYVVQLSELEEELYQEGVKQVKTYKDISWRISQLPDENERDVLFYRYIKGLKFWEIAQAMDYSEEWIHKLHGRALKKLEIVKEYSLVQ